MVKIWPRYSLSVWLNLHVPFQSGEGATRQPDVPTNAHKAIQRNHALLIVFAGCPILRGLCEGWARKRINKRCALAKVVASLRLKGFAVRPTTTARAQNRHSEQQRRAQITPKPPSPLHPPHAVYAPQSPSPPIPPARNRNAKIPSNNFRAPASSKSIHSHNSASPRTAPAP